MEWMQEQSTVSTALALETVREWTLWLTEVERCGAGSSSGHSLRFLRPL
jgi:hypothetical protein